jgi:hypothetical protein
VGSGAGPDDATPIAALASRAGAPDGYRVFQPDFMSLTAFFPLERK